MAPLVKITHIAHVIDRLAVGGMENGIVNLINTMPSDQYRHSVVCVKSATDFRQRIRREDVEVHELNKAEGKDPSVYLRFWRLMRKIRPDIVHTRNLGTLDLAPVAALSQVPIRVHGEHGWEATDLRGTNRRYRRLRRVCDPFVRKYVAVSRDLATWLRDDIRVPVGKIRQIYNGVDTSRFTPHAQSAAMPFAHDDGVFVFGFVGRMDPVKGLNVLVDAFARLVEWCMARKQEVRLVMIGEGSERVVCESRLRKHGVRDLAWFPGRSDDIPGMMRALDAFVLPSMNEGISNTVLEAMSTSLPIIATAVGGNPELVDDGIHGVLVPSGDADALLRAMKKFVDEPDHASELGAAARRRVDSQFSLDAMANNYSEFYQELLVLYRAGANLRAA